MEDLNEFNPFQSDQSKYYETAALKNPQSLRNFDKVQINEVDFYQEFYPNTMYLLLKW